MASVSSGTYTYAVNQEVWVWDDKAGWSLGSITSVAPGAANIKLKNGKEAKTSLSEKELLPRNPPDLWDVDNLMSHEFLHEASLIETLTIRYNRSCIYTYSGPVLISLNPYRYLEIYGSDFIKKYRGANLDKSLPHVYAIAEGAYKHLLEDKKNQSILITGESGAGKTEATKLMLKYLATVATRESDAVMSEHMNPLMRMKRVEQQIIDSSPITEAFGNAKTVRNDNSSRFGKFMELQFDNHGMIIGAKIVNYMLEKSRIVTQAEQERGYHIFYMVCVGLTAAERQDLKLRSPETFTIINKKCLTISGKNDVEDMTELKAAFSTCGVGQQDQLSIFRMVAAVLHTGDIKFVGDEESQVKTKDALDTAALMLGVNADKLSKALTTQNVSVAGSVITKNRTPAQADWAREALCKGIFDRLFDFIISRINASVCRESCAGFIGLLDIFGFEIFEINSFEQFCINYTNEKLQQHFNLHMFHLERAEYETEGVPLGLVEFHDNTPCVNLFEAKPEGMIAMLDEECTIPKATDQSWVAKLYTKFSKHEYFLKPKTSQTAFIVKHFAGDVMYECANFMDKNMDPLSDDIINCLKTSSQHLVLDLFAEAFAEAESRSKGSRTKKSSVGTAFKQQLIALTDRLSSTEAFYVRTIKPNSIKSTNTFDTAMVLRQLQCSGVLEAMRIRRAGFPVRRRFEEFLERYRIVKPTQKCPDMPGRCGEIIKAAGILDEVEGKRQWTTGRSKVFLRESPYSRLEAQRELALGKSALKIQCKWRQYFNQKRFKKMRIGIRQIQAKIRRIKPFNKFMSHRLEAKLVLAKFFRGSVYRRMFLTIKRIATIIKRCSVRNRYQRKFWSALKISNAVRQHRARVVVYKKRVELLGKIEAEKRAAEEKKKREEEEKKRQLELKRLKDEEERVKKELEEKLLKYLEEQQKQKEEEERKKQEEQEMKRAKKAAEIAARKKAEMEEEAALLEDTPEALLKAQQHQYAVEYARFKEMATAIEMMPTEVPTEEPQRKGFMQKQGGGWKSWKQRYFVLIHNKLSYYKTVKEGKEQGEVLLEDVHISHGDKEVSKPNCIKITTAGRIYFLCCENAAEKEVWLDVMCKSMLYHLAKSGKAPASDDGSTALPTLSFPTTTGWLIKEGGKKKQQGQGKLQRRWFVMRESSLYYFKTPADSFHKGVISLRHSEHSALEDTPTRQNAFELKLPDRTFTLYAKSPEERQDWLDDVERAKRLAERMEKLREKVHKAGLATTAVTKEKNPNFEGFLMKRGERNTTWKKRWFSLNGGRLSYFKNHKDTKPTGTIMLVSFRVLRCDAEHGAWSLTLMTPGRHYIVKADTEKEILQWYNSLAPYQSLSTDFNTLPEKRGYMDVTLGEGPRKWKKCYFSLKDFSLYYYKNKESGVPMVELELEDCKLRNFSGQDGTRKFIFELIAKTNSFLLACETSEERDEWKALIQEHKDRYEDDEKLSTARKQLRAKRSDALEGKRDMEGMLGKMCPGGDWRPRYCALVGLTLHYFKKQEDKVPCGSVGLEDVAVDNAEQRVGVRNALELFSPIRNYYFACQSANELQQWIVAIRANQERFLQTSNYVVDQEENPQYPRRVVLSINENGIQIVRFGDDGVVSKYTTVMKKDTAKEILATYPFQDIFSWSSTITSFSFYINSTKKRYIFRTTAGSEITACVQQTAIRMFEQASQRTHHDHHDHH